MNTSDFDTVYKQKLLDTFKFLIDFLNNHNLRWWCAYGTIIGAVRHHGFIPWDDDIDILMPREDYEKLISLKQELIQSSNGHYDVGHVSTDAGYTARLAKVMDMTTSIQSQRFIPSVMGVFVDVFPLDPSCDNDVTILNKKDRVNKAWTKYFEYIKHYYLADFWVNRFSFKKLINMLRTNRKTNKLAKQKALEEALTCEHGVSKVKFDESPRCFSLYGMYNEREIYKTDWFRGYEEYTFESYTVRIPSGYHELLTLIYGDYMTPPPVEKRAPRHMPYYANLKERLSLEEIKKRVRLGETLVY